MAQTADSLHHKKLSALFSPGSPMGVEGCHYLTEGMVCATDLGTTRVERLVHGGSLSHAPQRVNRFRRIAQSCFESGRGMVAVGWSRCLEVLEAVLS